MAARCLITGVVLLGRDGIAYNGDLFDQGDTYIVNCNEQSAHTLDTPFDHINVILPPPDFWERRGVFVFPKRGAVLSRAARNYIEGAPDAD